jgi:hypothetical protein
MFRFLYRKQYFIFLIILFSIFFFAKCVNNSSTQKSDDKGLKSNQYAGSAKCATCHQDIYNTHIKTAHFLTSQKSSEQNIKGSMENDKNKFYYNPYIYVAVQKRGDIFYQVEYVNGVEKFSRPVDITVGSGKRGQTFLNWSQNRLFQLPLTYFTSLGQWTNSPGFSNRVVFNRPITSRCLECHSTYFEVDSKEGAMIDEFSNAKIIYGVDCEKCHGPGAQHVDFQTKNPTEKKAQFIINPKNLDRQQNLDNCRLCHGGRLAKTKPSFSFIVGDRLSDYFHIDSLGPDVTNIDVHGNQYGMMAASKCFRMSQMTCQICHNPHENETGKKEVFSQRCISCHSEQHNNFCRMKNKVGNTISNNCIDCHMPELPSKAIMVLLQGENIPTSASMRSHYISIYKNESDKFLNKSNK